MTDVDERLEFIASQISTWREAQVALETQVQELAEQRKETLDVPQTMANLHERIDAVSNQIGMLCINLDQWNVELDAMRKEAKAARAAFENVQMHASLFAGRAEGAENQAREATGLVKAVQVRQISDYERLMRAIADIETHTEALRALDKRTEQMDARLVDSADKIEALGHKVACHAGFLQGSAERVDDMAKAIYKINRAVTGHDQRLGDMQKDALSLAHEMGARVNALAAGERATMERLSKLEGDRGGMVKLSTDPYARPLAGVAPPERVMEAVKKVLDVKGDPPLTFRLTWYDLELAVAAGLRAL